MEGASLGTEEGGEEIQDEPQYYLPPHSPNMTSSRFLQIQIPASEASNFQNTELKHELVVKHPNFTQDSVEHDLMLIKLQRPLKPSDGQKLAILPNTTDDKPGTTCTVFGWGWTWKEYSEWPLGQRPLEC